MAPQLGLPGSAAGMGHAPFDGDLVGLMRRLAGQRSYGHPMAPEEWSSYCQVRCSC